MRTVKDIVQEFIQTHEKVDPKKFESLENQQDYVGIHAVGYKKTFKNTMTGEEREFNQPGMKMSYFPIEDFNQLLHQIIQVNLEKGKLTDKYGNYMMNKVFNYIYIDFDFFTTDSDFENDNIMLAEKIEKLVRDKFKPKYILTFVPATLTQKGGIYKCGFHINVFMDYVLTYEMRNELALEFKKAMLLDEGIADWWDLRKDDIFQHENDSSPCQLVDIFDEARFKETSSHILPFCQKNAEARQYKLHKVFNLAENDQMDYIIPASAEMYNGCMKSKAITFNRSLSDDDYSIEFVRNIGQLMIDRHEVPFSKLDDIPPKLISLRRREIAKNRLIKIHQQHSKLIDAEMFLYDFFDGVSMMCETVPIIKAFKKGGSFGEMNHYIIEVVKFWYMLYSITNEITNKPNSQSSIETEGKDAEEIEKLRKLAKRGSYDYEIAQKVPEIMMIILMPLFIRGGKTDDEGIISIILSSINFMSAKNCRNNESKRTELFDDETNLKEDLNYFQALYKPFEIYHFHKFVSLNEKQKAKEMKNNAADYSLMCYDHGRLLGIFKRILSQWFKFVQNEIFGNITREIEPFNPYTKERSNEFNFIKLYSNQHYIDEYNYQIGNLNKMFIFVLVGESSINLYESAIYKIISKYVKDYVRISKKNGSLKAEDKEVHIYNIRQTGVLQKMPHDQYILDNNSALRGWITMIYEHTIKTQEQTSIASSIGGVKGIIKLIFDKFKMLEMDTRPGVSTIEKLKTKGGTNLVEQAYRYIVGYDSNTDQYIGNIPPMRDLPQKSEYLSVFNGMIKYLKDPKTQQYVARLQIDNRNVILDSYTLAEYVPFETYDFNNRVYKDLMKIISEIYPIEEEREYMLNMYATCVCPMITKDQMIILYGTGSDGKSTMNKIIQNMLGYLDSTDIVVYNGDKPEDQIILNNPRGYATTFKSSTLVVSEKGSNHNEGGVVNFDKKTFAVAQEPPQSKIHTEVVKEMLSGNALQARRIKQASQQILCNALVILETNQIPQFDIIDNAVRRRITMCPHRAKFLMSSTQQYKNKKYIYKADSAKIERIIKDVRYWQALLVELVRRSVQLLNSQVKVDGKLVNGISQTSNIPIPASFRKFTESAFGRTNGLHKWLDSAILSTNCGFISIYELINLIKKRNASPRMNKDPSRGYILDARGSELEMMKEIKTILQNKYEDHIFSLNMELISRQSKNSKRLEVDLGKVQELEKKTRTMSLDILRSENIIGQFALDTIDSGNDPSLKDVVLVGHDYNEDDEDIQKLFEDEFSSSRSSVLDD